MRNQLMLLHLRVFQLNAQVQTWAARDQGKVYSSRAEKRLWYLHDELQAIALQVGEMLDPVAASETQSTQQHPTFWLLVENDLVCLLQQEPELDGVLVLLQKESIDEVVSPNYARISYAVTLEDLIL